MLKCIYCGHVMEEPESGLPEYCPDCQSNMAVDDWERIDGE